VCTRGQNVRKGNPQRPDPWAEKIEGQDDLPPETSIPPPKAKYNLIMKGSKRGQRRSQELGTAKRAEVPGKPYSMVIGKPVREERTEEGGKRIST